MISTATLPCNDFKILKIDIFLLQATGQTFFLPTSCANSTQPGPTSPPTSKAGAQTMNHTPRIGLFVLLFVTKFQPHHRYMHHSYVHPEEG